MEHIKTDTVQLDKIPVMVRREFDRRLLNDVTLDPELFIEHEVARMVMELRDYVLAEKTAEREVPVYFEESVSFRFPSNPWQHLKQRFAPKWFLRRWPVEESIKTRFVSKRKVVKTAQFALYPAMPLKVHPDYRGQYAIRFEQVSVR